MPLINGVRKTCESCGRGPDEKHRATMKPPSMNSRRWLDSVVPATDGCDVEPDGKCEHGHSSWLLIWGLI